MTHRVEVPTYMNVPARSLASDNTDQNDKSLFRRKAKVEVRDCAYRANACRRAGRTKAEANAYFSMGIWYDNIGKPLEACRCYMQVIQTLDGIVEDVLVTCLAYNSIAISLYNAGPTYWDQAVHYNQLHLDHAATEGKFSAFTNLGSVPLLFVACLWRVCCVFVACLACLACLPWLLGSCSFLCLDIVSKSSITHPHFRLMFTEKNDRERAADCHKDALRCALKLKSVQKQAIAIGNLGLSGYKHQDYVTAEACMERHLQLSKTLDDIKGQARATKLLGEIANRKQDYNRATGYFRKSMQLSKMMEDSQSEAAAKIQLGVSLARSRMDDHMKHAAALGFDRPYSH